MNAFLKHKWRAWRSDQRGNFAVLSALAAAPLALLVAGGVSYSNAVTLRAKTQAAADAAVLAANIAYANGQVTTTAAAQTIATNVFALDAPSAAQSAGTFTPVTTVNGATVTTTGAFTGSVPSLFSNLVGDLPVDVNAKASASMGPAQAPAGNSQTFNVSGDPHFFVGDTEAYTGSCALEGGSTYTAFYSDYNLQVNAQCYEETGAEQAIAAAFYANYTAGMSIHQLSNMNMNRYNELLAAYENSIGMTNGQIFGVWDYAIIVAGHKISLTLVNQDPSTWAGDATIDGIHYASPANNTTNTILNDANNGVTLVQNDNGGYNTVTLTTPEYTIEFGGDEDSLAMYVSMINGAVCGTPGGFLGQLWGAQSTWDLNPGDFDITPWGTSPEYSATCASLASSSAPTTTKLVQ